MIQVKSTCCSPEDLGFSPRTHMVGGSQPSVIPVPEDPARSSDLSGHQAHMCVYIHAGKRLKSLMYILNT